MTDGLVLEFSGVTKQYGKVTAVSDFSARIEPGEITGFLGPNGAGKTTSLRILMGLAQPTRGQATIGGTTYRELKSPLHTVGAALEATSFHPGRTARNHLAVYATAGGVSPSRIAEVLSLVDLDEAADRKVGGFSLGMRQRLSLATALLGDPGVLVLDEPSNGLDPEGIKWMRTFLRKLAREGRTIFVSSHMLGEIQQIADAVIVISHGKKVFDGDFGELVALDSGDTITVDSPDRAGLARALTDAGLAAEVLRSGLTVRGATASDIGTAAAAAGVVLSALSKRGPSVEDIFLDLVSGARVQEPATALHPDDQPDVPLATMTTDAPDSAEGITADSDSGAHVGHSSTAVSAWVSAAESIDPLFMSVTDGDPMATDDGVEAAADGGSATPTNDRSETASETESSADTAAYEVASTGVISVLGLAADDAGAAGEHDGSDEREAAGGVGDEDDLENEGALENEDDLENEGPSEASFDDLLIGAESSDDIWADLANARDGEHESSPEHADADADAGAEGTEPEHADAAGTDHADAPETSAGDVPETVAPTPDARSADASPQRFGSAWTPGLSPWAPRTAPVAVPTPTPPASVDDNAPSASGGPASEAEPDVNSAGSFFDGETRTGENPFAALFENDRSAEIPVSNDPTVDPDAYVDEDIEDTFSTSVITVASTEPETLTTAIPSFGDAGGWANDSDGVAETTDDAEAIARDAGDEEADEDEPDSWERRAERTPADDAADEFFRTVGLHFDDDDDDDDDDDNEADDDDDESSDDGVISHEEGGDAR